MIERRAPGLDSRNTKLSTCDIQPLRRVGHAWVHDKNFHDHVEQRSSLSLGHIRMIDYTYVNFLLD